MAEAIAGDRKTVIAVMGTGRSGTSLITKILNLLGVHLGDDGYFIDPMPANPKGYFELRPILKFNNELLTMLGGNWCNPPDLEEGWIQRTELDQKHRELKGIIREIYGDAPIWAWKDPRSCWLLPFWRQHLPPLLHIFALRNPIEVAESLMRANNLTFDEAIQYWHRALNAALQNTRGEKRLFVFYEDIIDGCERELARIARFIGKEPCGQDPAVIRAVQGFVEEKLHRNRSSTEEVMRHEKLTFPVKALYLALRANVKGGGSDYVRALETFSRISWDGDVLVSIIIPLHGRADLTRRCIDSLYAHTPASPGFEVILVDNGSLDETPDYLQSLQERHSNLRVLSSRVNRGFSKGCNQGARAARGKHLLFLNNDTEVKPGWLEALVDVMERDPKVAAVGSKLVYPNGTIQNAGILMVDDRKAFDPLVARPIYYRQPAHLAEANQRLQYQALTAACVLVRRSAFQKVGGFDEGYWNGYEDVDLSFKLQEQGWISVYEPRSEIIHLESQSGPERFAQAKRNIARLHERWLGKITPDVILEQDGRIRSTRSGRVRPYPAPDVKAAEALQLAEAAH